MTAHPLDIRMAHLEGAYEQVSDRLNGFDTRFATIESKIDDLRDSLMNEMNRRFERVDAQFGRVDAQFERVDAQFERVDAQFERVDRHFERIDDRFSSVDGRFKSVDEQFAEMRKLIINGGFAIGAFVLISILLPVIQRFH